MANGEMHLGVRQSAQLALRASTITMSLLLMSACSASTQGSGAQDRICSRAGSAVKAIVSELDYAAAEADAWLIAADLPATSGTSRELVSDVADTTAGWAIPGPPRAAAMGAMNGLYIYCQG
jgi:hypothetical protein